MAGFTGAPPIVTDGLVFAVDAANYESYTSGSSTWYDLSGNGNHVNLYNSPIFSDNMLFGDGIDVYGRTQNTLDLTSYNAITIISAFYVPSGSSSTSLIYEHSSNWNSSNNNYGGFGWAANSDGYSFTYGVNHVQFKGNSGYSGKNLNSNVDNIGIYAVVHDVSQSGQDETSIYPNGSIEGSYGTKWNSDNTNNFGNEHLYLWSRNGSIAIAAAPIAFIFIYNKALSEIEIAKIYNALKSRFNL